MRGLMTVARLFLVSDGLAFTDRVMRLSLRHHRSAQDCLVSSFTSKFCKLVFRFDGNDPCSRQRGQFDCTDSL